MRTPSAPVFQKHGNKVYRADEGAGWSSIRWKGSEMLRTCQMICTAHFWSKSRQALARDYPLQLPLHRSPQIHCSRWFSPQLFHIDMDIYGTRIHRSFCVWKGWNWIKHGRSAIWEWSTHAAAWAARAKGIVPVKARDFKNNHLVRQVSGVV